jgi:TRAP transporter TAXI family solute receptor
MAFGSGIDLLRNLFWGGENKNVRAPERKRTFWHVRTGAQKIRRSQSAKTRFAGGLIRHGLVISGFLLLGTVASFAQLAPSSPRALAELNAADAKTRNLIDQTNQNTVSIISGNPAGTYLSIAYDIAAVLDQGNKLRVLPIVGKGATQNTMDLLFLRGVDMGITQSNVLNYFRKTNELGDISSRIVYIAKLFNEELHLVVTSDIKSIEDLAGKPVNFSDPGSGTQFTAREIFDALGIKVREVNMGQSDAFEKMRSGEIVGTVQIVGKPSTAFSKIPKDSGFHLLPVPYVASLQDAYFPAVISSEDYPNFIPAGQEIETVAVGAVLAAYNWPENTDRYRRLDNFVNQFFSNFAELQKAPRHPKWQEVNLGAVLPRWKRFEPAQNWLDGVRTAPAKAVVPSNGAGSAKPISTTGSVNSSVRSRLAGRNEAELRKEFEQFLASQPGLVPSDDQDREQLFDQFLRWKEEAPR